MTPPTREEFCIVVEGKDAESQVDEALLQIAEAAAETCDGPATCWASYYFKSRVSAKKGMGDGNSCSPWCGHRPTHCPGLPTWPE